MTQEKNQTAVEWLINELVKKGFPIEKHGIDLYQQALAMEKEQIVNAHLTGLIYPLEIEATKQAQQYYNETYGKEKN